jgi:hypothetical protein
VASLLLTYFLGQNVELSRSSHTLTSVAQKWETPSPCLAARPAQLSAFVELCLISVLALEII